MKIPNGFHIHKNGGGLVENTAKVADTAYIGPNAKVRDKARVLSSAWVSGHAVIADNTWVSGHAVIGGYTMIKDKADISGNARINGNAEVYGDAKVQGDAVVSGHATVCGDILIYGGIIETSEIWGLYDSVYEQWVDKNEKNDNLFDFIIAFSWADIKNLLSKKGIFAIPLVKGIPQFNEGIKL